MLSNKTLSVFVFSALMVGCATSPEETKQQYEKVAVEHQKYENQLIDRGQSHAYISGVPHQCESYPLKSSLFCAFVVDSVDGKPVEFTVPYVPFGHRIGYFPVSYSRLFLKIPAGIHDISVRGGKSRPYSKNITVFKSVKIEAGKYYAITEKIDKNEDAVNFIAEYKSDNNFPRSVKEHYKIIKPVSQYVYPNSDEVAAE